MITYTISASPVPGLPTLITWYVLEHSDENTKRIVAACTVQSDAREVRDGLLLLRDKRAKIARALARRRVHT